MKGELKVLNKTKFYNIENEAKLAHQVLVTI